MMTESELIDDAVSSGINKKARRLLIFLGLLCLLSLGAAVVLGFTTYRAVENQAAAGTGLAQQVQAACADPARPTEDLSELCDEADAVVDSAPEAVQGPPGQDGEDGQDGDDALPPSATQIETAVIRYCADGRCQGEDGEEPTPEDVQLAVITYCDANGDCTGPAGASGSNGTNGADGANGTDGAPGAQGPPPSDEQVAGAVVTYCSTRNDCRGPAGPEGPQGRGIVSVACESTEVTSFTLVYSDGSSEEVSCFPNPEEPEEPSPTPTLPEVIP